MNSSAKNGLNSCPMMRLLFRMKGVTMELVLIRKLKLVNAFQDLMASHAKKYEKKIILTSCVFSDIVKY